MCQRPWRSDLLDAPGSEEPANVPALPLIGMDGGRVQRGRRVRRPDTELGIDEGEQLVR